MTEIKPQFLDTLSYAGKFDRQLFRDILTEGVVGTNDLKVTEKGTPNMSVDVAIGSAYVQGDQAATQGHYRIYNDATVNKAIAASNPTNPRKDRVIAQIKDITDIGDALDEWEIQVLTGTPEASPSAPALPDNALDLAIVLVGNGVTEITNANITDQRERIGFQNVSDKGWITAGETWTYASADAPTYTITVPTDATTKYSAGMKIKLTHGGSVKYFIITKVAATVLTLYGGTDYTLAATAITLPYYSTMKAPLGFPLDPDKWTVKVTDTTERTQPNPVQNTWYNLGSISIDIPLGIWNVNYMVMLRAQTGKTYQATLSTVNNTESDAEFSTFGMATYMSLGRGKNLNLTVKDTYYLNSRTTLEDCTLLHNYNDRNILTIRAICAYL